MFTLTASSVILAGGFDLFGFIIDDFKLRAKRRCVVGDVWAFSFPCLGSSAVLFLLCRFHPQCHMLLLYD
jgi:hypothetical protein